MLRAAIIGCGRIAGGYDKSPAAEWSATHAGAYRLCADTELVAAADVAEASRQAFGAKWGVDRLYADYAEMLDRERPDLVSICVPPSEHLPALRAACRTGARGIWLEKPVAPTAADARAAITIAGSRPVAVNYFRRWNPSLAELRTEIIGGAFGPVRRVTVHYVKGLLGNASHFIDVLRWFLGEPRDIRPFRVHGMPADDPPVDFELAFDQGTVATFLHVPHAAYVLHDVDLFFDRQRVIIGQRGQQLVRFEAVEEPHYGGFDILRRVSGDETHWRRAALSALEDLIGCLDSGRAPACTLEDGARAVEICAAVRDLVVAASLQETAR